MSFVVNLIKKRIDPETFLDNFRPEDVYYADNFHAIKYAAYYFIDNFDEDGAAVFAEKLAKIVSSLSPTDASQRAVAEILTYWFLRLKVFSFRILPSGEQNELLKTYIVSILENHLNLRQTLFKMIDIFSSGAIIQDLTKNFVSVLTGSVAILGSNSQAFDKNNFKPSVTNWLKEYQSVLRSLGGNVKLQPGAFHNVKFLDTNQYVKLLTAEEKEILKSLLDLYNWLLDPIVYDDRPPDRDLNRSYISQEKYQLPSSLASSEPVTQESKPPPSIPAPKNVLPQRRIEEVRHIPNQNKTTAPPFTQMDKQDAIVPGISFGSASTTSDVKELVKKNERGFFPKDKTVQPSQASVPASSTELKEAFIDKKLQELEKRTKKE